MNFVTPILLNMVLLQVVRCQTEEDPMARLNYHSFLVMWNQLPLNLEHSAPGFEHRDGAFRLFLICGRNLHSM
jgi:hypothetical protein